jgi:high-affinity Fe2+/Pb2+ permease
MAVQGAYAAAFVVFGKAALSGRISIVITALLLLVALALLFSNVLSRLKSNSAGTHEPN